MRDVPRYFDEQIANMRAGLARGFSVPRATLEGRDASVAAFLADDVAKSPFHKAFDTMPATIPAAEQQALRAQGEAAIREAVEPAYRKLLDFYPHRISAEGADHGLGPRPARRRRILPGAGPRIYDARPQPRGDPPARTQARSR